MRWPDVLGIGWIVLFALLYLSPALKDGTTFGPTSLGTKSSALTRGLPHEAAHNFANGDLISQDLPWSTLDYELVHHGEFPLWNDLSGTGLPQFLNFESAVLALPSLLSYLVPIGIAFLVSIAAKLLIAGTGIYVLMRLLRASPLAAALSGTTFMLSGAFTSWLGWANSGSFAWMGWIGVGIVMCYRSRASIRQLLVLGGAIAFAIYGGMPEADVLMAIGIGVTILVGGVFALAKRQRFELRGVVRVALGVMIGVGLAAPLWLPGLSIALGAARNTGIVATGLPLKETSLLLAQGYDGLPITGSGFFGPSNYYESAAYVGIIAAVLVGVAITSLRRRPLVAGLVGAGLFSCVLIYGLGIGPAVNEAFRDIGLGDVALQRMLSFASAVVALLGGFGLDLVRTRWRERSTAAAFAVATVALGAVLFVMWHDVAPQVVTSTTGPAGAHFNAEALRQQSLYWPFGQLVLLLAVAVILVVARRFRRDRLTTRLVGGCLSLLVISQSLFLLFAGVGINSYARTAFPKTAATTKLKRIVGNKLLGFDGGNNRCTTSATTLCGLRRWTGLGFYPEINLGYGIHELAMHDPIIPKSYFSSWPVQGANAEGLSANLFVPSIDNLGLARRYGVSFVLVKKGLKVPRGMHEVAVIAGMALVDVPGAKRFGFVPATPKSSTAKDSPRSKVETVRHVSNSTYELTVRSPRASVLVARVTAVPGWHASAGGRPLVLHRFEGSFLSIKVPPGTTHITLSYWPRLMSAGLFIAGTIIVCLALCSVVLERRRRRTKPRPRSAHRNFASI